MPTSLPARRRLVVAASVAAVVAAPLVTGPGVSAAGSTMGAGRTLLVSPNARDGGAAGAASVSDDGRVVAYQRQLSPRGVFAIEVADLLTGGRVRVGEAGQDSTAPSLSGDGRLVAFQTKQGAEHQTRGELADTDVWVTDLGTPGRPSYRVTGTGSDLRHQRVPGCSPTTGAGRDGPASVAAADRCGPQLSGDGTALAMPAVLSLEVPQLTFRVPGREGHPFVAGSTHSVGLLDFGQSSTSQVLEITVTGRDPVRFTAVEVVAGGDAFRVAPDPRGAQPCVGATLEPGQSCGVRVELLRGAGCGPVLGRLLLDSPTPRGQSAVSLVGDLVDDCLRPPPPPTPTDPQTSEPPVNRVAPVLAFPRAGPVLGRPGAASAPVPAAALTCPDPQPLTSAPSPRPDQGLTSEVHSLHEVPLGGTTLLVQELRNDSGLSREVRFASSSCGMRLLDLDLGEPTVPGDPVEPGTPGPTPCSDGLLLGSEQRCVAYLELAALDVEPYAATLSLSRPGFAPDRVFRFTGAGTQRVVVVRRDPDAEGRFTGPGRPPATVASMGEGGTPVDGVTPSLSTDGRHLAFVTTANGQLRRPQVLVHDTDRDGDRSFRSGPTQVASVDGDGATPAAAYQPSISGDGTRLAYVGFQEPVGRAPVARLAATAPGYHQVWVRDLARPTAVLVSTPPGSELGGLGDSWSPALSRDGSTVAFTSDARQLRPADGDVCCAVVYVQDLGRDLGTPTRAPGAVSLRPVADVAEEAAGAPALDALGAVVAFQSADALLPAVEGGTDRVYARSRHADLVLSPLRIAFPALQLGGPGPVEVVEVVNAGPGPARLAVTPTGPYSVDEGCPPVLHRDESCTLAVEFRPETVGRHPGRLTVGSSGLDWSERDVVELVGAAVAQAFTVRPPALSFPETGIDRASDPQRLSVTNVTGTPLAVSTVVPPDTADFEVTAGASCADLQPAATCRVRVVFRPTQLGPRVGTVDVTADVGGEPVVQVVPLDGLTATPEITYSPAVAHEGRVTFVRGTDFPPGRLLLLQWSRGPVGLPAVLPAEDGTFAVPTVMIRGGGAGPRDLTVVMPGVSETVEAPPLLVVRGSLQPPDFRTRN